uniref:ER lumen protein-retaining receptor n=1 Tax=Plectus sambesii TaxID=2011161 RepID=A0A914VHX6_9BILA
MNIFRLAGDLAHLVAIVILLLKIWKTRSCAGISGRSQLLFALVFASRYLDLFTNYVSLYNSAMKVFFLVTSFGTLYLMWAKFKATYDRDEKQNDRASGLIQLPAIPFKCGIDRFSTSNRTESMMNCCWLFS